MANMTLAEARTLVGKLTQDPDGARHTQTDGGDVDQALRAQIRLAMRWFAQKGGVLFGKILDVTTDASGEYDLSSDDVCWVHAVQTRDNADNTVFSAIKHVQIHTVRQTLAKAQNIRIHATVMPDTTWSTPATDPLISGANATTAHQHSDEAFERYVCYRAAIELVSPEQRQNLGTLIKQRERYERDLLRQLDLAGSSGFDEPGAGRVRLGWFYRGDTQVLGLSMERSARRYSY